MTDNQPNTQATNQIEDLEATLALAKQMINQGETGQACTELAEALPLFEDTIRIVTEMG